MTIFERLLAGRTITECGARPKPRRNWGLIGGVLFCLGFWVLLLVRVVV